MNQAAESARPRSLDLVLTNATVLTMDRDRRIIEHGAVAVSGDRIAAVGTADEIASGFKAPKVVDVKGGLVQPGFVDAHVHLSQHLGRSTIPDSWPESHEHDQWLGYWLEMTPDDAYLSALLACIEMLHNGTTTFCDMGGRFEAEIQARAANDVGLRGAVSEICWDRPPYRSVSVGTTDDCVRRLERLAEQLPFGTGARVWGAIGLAGMGQASDELLIEAKRIATAGGSVMSMHQSFARADVEAYRAQTGTTAVAHLSRLGILGPDLSLVHMIHTEPEELHLLAASGTNVVHCPGASIRTGMGVSRVGHFPEMLDLGINVALGSDSGNYADTFDIGRQAFLAATIHREARGENPVISAEQALEMATIGGARALGLEAEIGSIEVGKRADLVVHGRSRPEWHPALDVVYTLVYSAQSTGVEMVVVDGRVVLERRAPTQVDEAAAYASIDTAARSLFKRMGWPVRRWPPPKPGQGRRTSPVS